MPKLLKTSNTNCKNMPCVLMIIQLIQLWELQDKY